MGRISKAFAFFLTLIIAMSCLTLLVVKPTYAQSNVPSVPNFIISYIDSSYYSSPAYTPNPFTGTTPATSFNFYENKSIALTIQSSI